MDFYQILISILIGVPVGIAGSFIAWWIIYHKIKPVINFSSTISKIKRNPNSKNYTYRIKFENSGKRAILDLNLIVKLRIKGLNPSFSGNWEVLYIPIDQINTPIIKQVKKSRTRTTITLFLNKAEDFTKPIYPNNIRKKYLDNNLELEDLFKLGSKVTLQVYGFGYDEFSGVKKLFKSNIYSANDIKEGYFDRAGLEVKSQN